ncbi:helix-turn-helix domain-containing protein [Streptomyces alboflavus]|uniref:helix-turn-helix domain-containing protein n=1 Tax=Streptomyces alboflavus TaxID=67267 RepID=UPI00369661AF
MYGDDSEDGGDLEGGWDTVLPVGGTAARGVHVAGYRSHPGGRLDMRVLPQPFVTVVLGFGDALLHIEGDSGRAALPGLVAGPVPGPTRIRSGRFSCVELRLSPLAAYALLDTAPADLQGAVTSLEEPWGAPGRRLGERIAGAGGWPERFALVDRFLVERAARAPTADAEVAASWSAIVARRGRVRVGDLAAACGWSRKRLWARFTAQVGLTPKRAAMLVRFHCAARRLRAGADVAEAALACGYVDQSHLHREVREFTGCTPGALVRLATSADVDGDAPARAAHRVDTGTHPETQPTHLAKQPTQSAKHPTHPGQASDSPDTHPAQQRPTWRKGRHSDE